MGLLDGGIQALFGTVFGPLYLNGTLVRVTHVDDDEGGGTETASAPAAIKAQVDQCTEAMRQQPGYTATDVRLIILQAGVDDGDVNTDCRVTIGGATYEIASVTKDPANSYWDCRAQAE